MIVQILVENRSHSKQYLCEHGLSVMVTGPNFQLLVDTGQSDLFLKNAATMGIDLSKTTAVVCTHGHYDHTGGLAALLDAHPHLPVWLHAEAFHPRFSHSSVMTKPNGFPHPQSPIWPPHPFQTITSTTQIHPNIHLIHLPMNAPENPNLVVSTPEKTLAFDPFTDELFVLITNPAGAILITGCSHHPLPMVLDYLYQQFGISHYRCITGGLHLSGADNKAIQNQLDQCKKYKVSLWALNHCTGSNAINLWKQNHPLAVTDASTGTTIAL